MGWLIHNPIADMYGHDFLLFYGGIIVLTLVACWLKLRQSDPTASMPLPPVPSEPNPYETAYLRGGENEVTRVVIFGLTQRGYLQVTEEADKRIEQAPDHPDPAHLPQLERAVFEALQIPLSAEDIFKSVSLSSTVRSYCTTYEQTLQNEQLLTADEVKTAAKRIGLTGAAVIFGLGGYKLLIALAKGYSNVGFLIVMGIVSLVILFIICESDRLSSRGKKYLERLQLAFERLKGSAASVPSAAVDSTLLLLVGVFGVELLAGTPYAYYQEMFQRSSSGGGSCGAGCGSGGGDGCGGGCGGCGE